MTCKMGFICIGVIWIYPSQLVPTNLELPVISMIIRYPQIDLDDILAFLMFLSQKLIFQWRKFYIELIYIPFTPSTFKKSSSFFFKYPSLVLGMVRRNLHKELIIFIGTNFNAKCSFYQTFVMIFR